MPDAHHHTVTAKNLLMLSAAVFSGLGVALGAFGAHALRATLESTGHLDTWQTAVHYQLFHGLALFALAVWCRVAPRDEQPKGGRAIGWLWSLGIVCFSGSLFALSLGAPKGLLWPITPLGGLCFLAGWIVLALASRRATRPKRDTGGDQA